MDNSLREQSECKPKPICVVISDIHYSLSTLELADTALRSAIDKAAELGLPIIDAGDITNDKAILRAEIVNRLIETMHYANNKGVVVYLIVGNHSLCNEKGSEHSLNFLNPYATVIDSPQYFNHNILLIPYLSDSSRLSEILKAKASILIMHQGFLGAQMGDYIQDKTSVSPEIVKDFTVISGHYHRHQTIGTVTYIGSPYTMSFGEANDGSKGFLILNDDGSFTREILNLRKHVIKEFNSIDELSSHILPFGELFCNEDDLLWIKVKDKKSKLTISKSDLAPFLCVGSNFKLDLIPTDPKKIDYDSINKSPIKLMYDMIQARGETDIQKEYLKGLADEILTS